MYRISVNLVYVYRIFLVNVPVVVYHNTILASTTANNRDSKETVDELVRAIEVRTRTERFFQVMILTAT